jgi:hypothetical protein
LLFAGINQKYSCYKTAAKVNLPYETKNSRPRGSGPAQLIRAVLVEEFYLAVKELEQRGRPLTELLADQLY